jgi:hypothetical protein
MIGMDVCCVRSSVICAVSCAKYYFCHTVCVLCDLCCAVCAVPCVPVPCVLYCFPHTVLCCE